MPEDTLALFHRALWRHEPQIVAKLAPRIDPNAKHKWGTPLLWAAQWGDLAVIELLVRRGGDVDQGQTHLTPLTYAAKRSAADIVKFLRKQGAKVSIVTLVCLRERARVETLLKRDRAQARLRDEAGTPLLHHAAETGDLALVALLLKYGALVTDADEDGETALHRVADMRQAPQAAVGKVAAFLLKKKADPNAQNWDGVTPLHQAVRARNLAVTELLLKAGANPNARDRSRGSTPLRRAVSPTGAGGTAGTSELIVPLTKLLLKYGADPDSKDKRGIAVRASAKDLEVRAVLDEYRKFQRMLSERSRPNAALARVARAKRRVIQR